MGILSKERKVAARVSRGGEKTHWSPGSGAKPGQKMTTPGKHGLRNTTFIWPLGGKRGTTKPGTP